jgi:RNA polymerase sigma factor for flagellar operon FliA
MVSWEATKVSAKSGDRSGRRAPDEGVGDALDGLWRRYRRGKSEHLRNQLIEAYLPTVKSVAERLKLKLPESVDIDDLFSAGVIGLMDAIDKFEPERCVRFETYCSQRIRGAILDDLRKNDWVPRMIRTKSNSLDRTRAELAGELGREPTDEELAARLCLSVDEFYDMLEELDVKAQISIEGHSAANDDADQLRIDMLADSRRESALGVLHRNEVKDKALKGLSLNERTVLVMYYYDNLTMKEIGRVLRLSESRVCQIHAQLLQFLQRKFAKYGREFSSI